jgi:uncharacterized protein YdiU (UPF0061 family)
MIINIYKETYFVYVNNKLSIIKSKKELDFLIDNYSKTIITNNSDTLNKYENIIDFRVFNWLINNLANVNYLTQVTTDEHINELIKKQLKYIELNKAWLDKAKEYTSYHKKINSLFKFSYNKNYYDTLMEKYTRDLYLKQKVKEYKFNDLNLEGIDNKHDYSFLNNIGKIFPKNRFIIAIDRKLNKELFKTDKNKKYYLIDFNNFEPTMLTLYTGNKLYCNKLFYDIIASDFNCERTEIKNSFLMWLNGAGEKKLGSLLNQFNRYFSDVVEVKNNIINNSKFFTNFYHHSMLYTDDYKALGVLIQSTAYDYLMRFFSKMYNKYNDDRIRFIFNLFDEFLVECDSDFDPCQIFENTKINYKIEEW